MNKHKKTNISNELAGILSKLLSLEIDIDNLKEKLYPIRDKLYSESEMPISKTGRKRNLLEPMELLDKIIKILPIAIQNPIHKLEKLQTIMEKVLFESDFKNNCCKSPSNLVKNGKGIKCTVCNQTYLFGDNTIPG